jgi:hypothetical protein
MTSCSVCGREAESVFRFCPWCGRPQRIKLTEFFAGHPTIEGRGQRALRVSRYFGEEADERHVRFSVWSDSGSGETRVEAAVSLDEEEAERMARFLATTEGVPEPETR